jgi:hypothetical protein
MFVFFSAGLGADGSGDLRVEYIFLDEEGNLSVNQESFNLYDGPVISLENFNYQTVSGINFNANLNKMTLNNRNLRASAFKSGVFGVSIYNHQHRRIYDFQGNKFTRRRSTGVRAHFYPISPIKIFGGVNITDKHGQQLEIYPPVSDSSFFDSNYSHKNFDLGAELRFIQGFFSVRYRRSDFTDKERENADRQADQVELRGFAPVPQLSCISVASGYRYRQNKHQSAELKLSTNQFWAALKGYLPQGLIGEYRFLVARIKHDGNNIETDNFVNTVSIGKTWSRTGGARIGYENRIQDDLLDRSVAHLLFLSGWYRFNNNLMVRARFSAKMKEITTGTTLVGDEDFTRHQITIKYDQPNWGDLMVRYQGRIKTNEDINTRAEYNAFSLVLNIRQPEYGRIVLDYSYYMGAHENRSVTSPEEYEFSDHVLQGTVFLEQYRNLDTWFGGSYYRSRRDRVSEKIGANIGAAYNLPQNYRAELRYQSLNFDNFRVNDQYYTGNKVNISLVKSFTM